MAEETYGKEREERLRQLLRELAARVTELDARGELLRHTPELLRRLGDLRSELFHYEVRVTYDSPEVAERRRIVEEARRRLEGFELELDDPEEDDEPWRQRPDD